MKIDKLHLGRSRGERGVTLIELLVVIAVVSILSWISVSSYRRYAIRANRTDATTTLLRIQVAQEKYFLQNNQYVQTVANIAKDPKTGGLGVAIDGSTGKTAAGYYAIAFDSASATAYVLSATATGGQANDISACQVLKIDQNGARTPTESSGCWR